MYIKFSLIFLFILSQKSFSQDNNTLLFKIDSVLNEVYNSTDLGFSIGIIKGDSLIYSKGFGYADRENKIKNSEQTIYQIGSITKTFTAAAIGVLEEDNLLSLNDLAIRHLPQLNFSTKTNNKVITIEDLLSHNTKIIPHDLSWYWFPTSSDLYLKRIKFMNSNENQGSFNYNNTMYFLLGEIISKASGNSYENFLSKSFFQPLNMPNTFIKNIKGSKNIAKGYIYRESGFIETKKFDLSLMQAAGGINSNVMDLSKWLMTWMNDGIFNNQEILSTNFIKNAISHKNEVMEYPFYLPYSDIYSLSYGLGWTTTSYRGHFSCFLSGNIDGFSSIINFHPKEKIGIIILSNQDKTNLPECLNRCVSDILFNLPDRNWVNFIKKNYGKTNMVMEKKQEILPPVFNQILGKYQNKAFGTIEISSANNILYFNAPNARFKLYHLFDYYFKLIDVDTDIETEYQLSFIKNFEDEIEKISINLESSLDEIVFLKESTFNTNDYIGTYALGKFNIKISPEKSGDLLIILPGKPSVKLIPISALKYKVDGLNGYYVKFIISNDEKKIIGIKVIEPNRETNFDKIL